MCGKKCFTKIEAKGALKHNQKNGRQYRREQRMYYCKECNCWHLTSREDLFEEEPLNIEISPEWNKFLKTE